MSAQVEPGYSPNGSAGKEDHNEPVQLVESDLPGVSMNMAVSTIYKKNFILQLRRPQSICCSAGES